jgi:hypothetical protein
MNTSTENTVATATQTVGQTPASGRARPNAGRKPEESGAAPAAAARAARAILEGDDVILVDDAALTELMAGIGGALTLGQAAVENMDIEGAVARELAMGIRALGFKRVELSEAELKNPKVALERLGERGYAIVERVGKSPTFVADPMVMAALLSALKAPTSDVRRAIAMGTPELLFAADLELTQRTMDQMRDADLYQAPPKIVRTLTELEWWEYALIGVAIAVGAGGLALGIGYFVWGDKSPQQLPQI